MGAFRVSGFENKSIFTVYVIHAVQRRLLEYADALAPRTPLAGQLKFVSAIGSDAEKKRPRL